MHHINSIQVWSFRMLLVAVFLCLIPLQNIVHAQTYPTNPFNIKIYFSDQDPETKVFRIKAQIDSQISSDRNTLRWELPDGLKTTSNKSELIGYYCKITPGQNNQCNRSSSSETDDFDFVVDVVPYKAVKGDIIFSVQSYIDDVEKSYKVTQIAKVDVNSNLVLEPTSADYNNLQQIINIRQMSTQALFLVFALFVGLIILRRISLYISPPVKSTIPNDSKIIDAYQKLNMGDSLQKKPTK